MLHKILKLNQSKLLKRSELQSINGGDRPDHLCGSAQELCPVAYICCHGDCVNPNSAIFSCT